MKMASFGLILIKSKRMEQKYIIGDLVKYKVGGLEFIAEITNTSKYGYCFKGVSDDISGTLCKEFTNDIPLTPEILEKNEWKKEVMSRGVSNSHLVYTKPDIEEYGYFPIYIEKGIGNEFDVYPFTGNHVCTQIAYIKYVHQLQHLLFGLGLNHEMEV
jgi:hypothetical protein